MRKRFRKSDFIFIGILLLVCGLVFAGFQILGHTSGSSVQISRDGEILMTCSLMENQEIPIKDSKGNVTNVLEIKDGKAKMVEADCPDKLCMHQKAISSENENIVCLPNRVVVTVTGEDKGYDGLAQ